MPDSINYHITKRQSVLQRIHELHFVKKWGMGDIARALNLKVYTVNNWIRFINKRRMRALEGKEMDLLGVKNWTMEVRDFYFECIKQAWNEFAKSTSPKERMACMDRAQNAFREYFTAMQEMGIAPKVKAGEADSDATIVYRSLLKGTDGKIEVIEVKAEPQSTEVKDVQTL